MILEVFFNLNDSVIAQCW